MGSSAADLCQSLSLHRNNDPLSLVAMIEMGVKVGVKETQSISRSFGVALGQGPLCLHQAANGMA